MAMTKEYTDYLNDQVGIAPANSQEELQAAQLIAGVMEAHGLEAKLEEFDAPSLAALLPQLLNIVMLLGVLLVGAGSLSNVGVLTFIGFVLAIIPCVLAVLRFFGRDVPLAFGPKSRSQNVVAVHRASGPLVSKGSRPIVVVAHYDTPHQNALYTSPIAAQLPLAAKASRWAVYPAALCAFIQLLVFIPAPGRVFFWIVGIVACVPGVICAAGAITERVGGCTPGASSKASVAAMLGVLENVRPTGAASSIVEPTVDSPAQPEVYEEEFEAELVAEGSEAEGEDALGATVMTAPVGADFADGFAEPLGETLGATVVTAPVEEVLGVRHGEKTLRELGILPESCVIEYVEPAVAPVAPAPSASATSTIPMRAEAPADDARVAAEPAVVAPAVTAPAASEQPADPDVTRESLTQTGNFSLVMDGDASEGVGVGPKDSQGLTLLDDATSDLATPAPEPAQKPEAPSDPDWGKSTYRPQLSPVARRASLFDLPDPGEAAVDPFGKDPGATRVVPSQQTRSRAMQVPSISASPDTTVPTAPSAFDTAPVAPAASAAQVPPTMPAPEPVPAPAPSNEPVAEASEDEEPKGGLRGFFSRFGKGRKSKPAADADSWLGDDEDDEFGSWRGGATSRSGLRLVEGDEELPAEAPTDEDLRDAVLSMSDDALLAHDIWFVALGASALDHAGMRAFLAQHKRDIRGCFLINLDCVGAGSLTAFTHEGLTNTRRADRRLLRQIVNVATDLHVDLATKKLDWASTDATPAMLANRRSVTIMGMGKNGLAALDKTAGDVPENINHHQVANTTAIVTELIRRA